MIPVELQRARILRELGRLFSELAELEEASADRVAHGEVAPPTRRRRPLPPRPAHPEAVTDLDRERARRTLRNRGRR